MLLKLLSFLRWHLEEAAVAVNALVQQVMLADRSFLEHAVQGIVSIGFILLWLGVFYLVACLA